MAIVTELDLPDLEDFQAEQVPDTIIVSKITIDHTAQYSPEGQMPEEVARDYDPGDKDTITRSRYDDLRAQSERGKITFIDSVGGNGPNIGHRLRQFRASEEENPGLITVYTWGNSMYEDLLRLDLTHAGMQPELLLVDADMPEALVYPVTTKKGLDRIILGTNPELPADFDRVVVKGIREAVINSLPGTNWQAPLIRGTEKLTELGIPYTYTPGSAQIRAFKDGGDTEAIYNATESAQRLVVNRQELETLLTGRRQKPARRWRKLLGQGLDLGAQNVIVTDGKNGSYGANQDGTMVRVGLTRANRIRGLNGSGDGYLAGVIQGKGDLVEGMLFGSASASFAVQTIGAHENPPTMGEMRHRMATRTARLVYLSGSGAKNRKYL